MNHKLNIKSLEDLEDFLNNDLAWRKKEMISLKMMVDKDQVNEAILLRAGIALLCAHFEGFVRYGSNCYVSYVSTQKVACESLKNSFIAMKMVKEFKSCSASEKHSVHAKLLDKYLGYKEKKFQINITDGEGVISTHSNPGSSELKEILAALGIESDLFETKAHYIDESLLKNRHKVVHGEPANLERSDFLSTFSIIMDLIENYRKLIIHSAENKDYLKGAISRGNKLPSTDAK